jgi:TetR/AcrR family transcriptional regulator, tetracycline repressor protein
MDPGSTEEASEVQQRAAESDASDSDVIRRPLSRELVIQAALDNVKVHGLLRLTMRGLGQSLGVEAMSLYHHVHGREDLLEGMVDALVERVRLAARRPLGPTDGWQAYLLQVATALREVALDYPAAFPLVVTRHPSAPWLRPPLRSLEIVEEFLEALSSRGFTDEQAVYVYKAFCSTLIGLLLHEVAAMGAETGPVEEPLDEGNASIPQAHGSTDLEAFPLVVRMRQQLAENTADAEFVRSLEALLDRLDRELTQ